MKEIIDVILFLACNYVMCTFKYIYLKLEYMPDDYLTHFINGNGEELIKKCPSNYNIVNTCEFNGTLGSTFRLGLCNKYGRASLSGLLYIGTTEIRFDQSEFWIYPKGFTISSTTQIINEKEYRLARSSESGPYFEFSMIIPTNLLNCSNKTLDARDIIIYGRSNKLI